MTLSEFVKTRPAGSYVYAAATRTDNEPVWKYGLPICMLVADDVVDVIDGVRRRAIQRRDEMLAMQKEFGAAGRRDDAKWAKTEATDALKEYRAACLIMPLFCCEPPKDCPYREEWEWPVELAPWLDFVVREIECHEWRKSP